MSQATNLLENFSLNSLLGKEAMPTIVNQYLGAFRADPGETGALTSEVSNSLNYARVTLTPLMSSSSSGAIPNATDVLFNTASGSWGVISHLGIIDTSTYGTGRMWLRVSMSATVQIDAGEQLRFAASNLVFTCD